MLFTQGSCTIKSAYVSHAVVHAISYIFGIFKHVEGFAKRKITHNIKSSEVVHSDHVERLVRVCLGGFSQLGNKLVGIPYEEWFLLLESTV